MAIEKKIIDSLDQRFNSLIWKIEIDEENELIAIETRSAEKRSATFSVYNFLSGHCYFKEKSTENSWWWSLDRIHKGFMYLHGYKNEKSPERRGIIAWNAKTGEMAWQHFNYSLDKISAEGLIAHNTLIQPAREELLAPESGEIIRKNLEGYSELNRDIRFPEVYLSPSKPEFIAENLAGPIFYLEISEKTAWSFHVKTDEKFTQKLIVTENNSIILDKNLAEKIPKLNPEAFFMHKNYLFCIRDNNYIMTAYSL